MRPFMKNPCIFQKKGEISLCIFHHREGSPGTMRPLARFLAFYHWVDRPEQ
jgi:hypothetical protein